MARMRVYLGGPLDSQSGDRDLRWRRHASRFLSAMSVKAVNPVRDVASIAEEETSLSPQQIVRRDMRDVLSCDLVLANFTSDSYPAIGTSMEIKAAFDAGIPVIAVWPHTRRVPVFLAYHAAEVHDSLDDALAAIVNHWMLP